MIDTPKRLYCDFCGMGRHEVGELIAGPTVFICDQCVALATEVIANGPLGRWARERGAAEYDSWSDQPKRADMEAGENE